ncbi:MarR family winged helix-turn-helix transcriptional regulator [Cupriavidus sp. amp6]|uniref:MarR family winged helix-turn-helix transcriptional regulator n=1 Tax=Cupriavidus sp. amp6 TaxID=388051 RepID=UPI00040139E0|nr:MarR family transcriptional regulator [Cupriavidus sp. amp6]
MPSSGNDDFDLQTPESRTRLAPRRKPYWEIVAPGRHIGYYRGARSATWHARKFVGEGRYEEMRLGPCNDASAAPVAGALTYLEALAAADTWFGGPAPQRPRARQVAVAKAEIDGPLERLHSDRLDAISDAWARERPDIDFRLAGFFLRIEHAHYLHEQRLSAISRAKGVNIGDLHVLLALRRSGPSYALRPTDLFRTLLVTSGAITKRIDRLVQQALVERVADPDDRRSELVRLTRRGAAIADGAISRINKNLSAIVAASGITAAELATVDACFRKLVASM